MAAEKLLLPKAVRDELRRHRGERTQEDVAHAIDVDTELLGHYETGRRRLPFARLARWAHVLGLHEGHARAWWRTAIQGRISELLAEGGMKETDRTRVMWTIEKSWPKTAEAPPSDSRRAS